MSINNWGPAVWLLFHVIIEKIKDIDNVLFCRDLFNQIRNICKYLPCPDCAKHASIFLANVNINKINSKTDLKQIIFIFHNSVNTRKNKELFCFDELNKYTNVNLNAVLYNFKRNYLLNVNMKLLADNLQRKIIITKLYSWLNNNKHNLCN